MARKLEEVNLAELSASLREARDRKGWTLEELSHALWERGFPTSQNNARGQFPGHQAADQPACHTRDLIVAFM